MKVKTYEDIIKYCNDYSNYYYNTKYKLKTTEEIIEFYTNIKKYYRYITQEIAYNILEYFEDFAKRKFVNHNQRNYYMVYIIVAFNNNDDDFSEFPNSKYKQEIKKTLEKYREKERKNNTGYDLEKSLFITLRDHFKRIWMIANKVENIQKLIRNDKDKISNLYIQLYNSCHDNEITIGELNEIEQDTDLARCIKFDEIFNECKLQSILLNLRRALY